MNHDSDSYWHFNIIFLNWNFRQDLPLKIPDPVFKALLEIENKVQSGNQMKVKALNKDAEPDQCFFSRRGKRLIR